MTRLRKPRAPGPLSATISILKDAGKPMHKPAQEPNDLERFFVERANVGDVEGLIALYEANATLDCGDGAVLEGVDRIREFLVGFLKDRPQLAPGVQAPALRSGDLALTSSRLANGDVTAEIARRQPDGTWRWVVDQFALANVKQPEG